MPDSITRYTDILHVHYEVEDDDDGGEEEEEEDDEETDDGEETVEGHAEEEADYAPEVVQSPRASQTGASGSAQARVSFWVEEEVDKRRRTEGGEASSSQNEGNRNETDDFTCSICMEAWTNYGDHHIWCEQLVFIPTLYVYVYIFIYISWIFYVNGGFFFSRILKISNFVLTKSSVKD